MSCLDERDAIQKKTFTKWVNKHLKKVMYSKENKKKVLLYIGQILFI